MKMINYKLRTFLTLLLGATSSLSAVHAVGVGISTPSQSQAQMENVKIDQLLAITDKLTKDLDDLKEGLPPRAEMGVATNSLATTAKNRLIIKFNKPFENPPQIFLNPVETNASPCKGLQAGHMTRDLKPVSVTKDGFHLHLNSYTSGCGYHYIHAVNWIAVENKEGGGGISEERPLPLPPITVPPAPTVPDYIEDGGGPSW